MNVHLAILFYLSNNGQGSAPQLERRNILVSVEDVVWIVFLLELLEAIECFISKCSTDPLDRLISLHVVDVTTTAEGPWLNRRSTLPRPGNLFGIDGRILPDRQHTDIERGMAKANSS